MKNLRRTDRALETAEAMKLLANGEYGILSTAGKDDQPYGVPLSYVYKNNCLYFHSALEGHKIENIASNPKVSFCVVGHTRILPDQFATMYESALAFGVASEIEGVERHNALLWLLEKYSPAFIEKGKQYIEQKDQATKVIKIQIGKLSGKARR